MADGHPIPPDVAEMMADGIPILSDKHWRVAADATPYGTAVVLGPGEPVPDGLSVAYDTTPGPGFTPTDDEARQHAFRFANEHNADAADHWRRLAQRWQSRAETAGRDRS